MATAAGSYTLNTSNLLATASIAGINAAELVGSNYVEKTSNNLARSSIAGINAAELVGSNYVENTSNNLAIAKLAGDNNAMLVGSNYVEKTSNNLVIVVYNTGFAELGRTNGSAGYNYAVPVSGWVTLTNWVRVATNLFTSTPSNITVQALGGCPTTMFVRVAAQTHWSPGQNARGIQLAIFKNNVQVLNVDGIVLDNNASASTIIPGLVTAYDQANAGDTYDLRIQAVGNSSTMTEYGGSLSVEKR